jgi:hypothetical protein
LREPVYSEGVPDEAIPALPLRRVDSPLRATLEVADQLFADETIGLAENATPMEGPKVLRPAA